MFINTLRQSVAISSKWCFRYFTATYLFRDSNYSISKDLLTNGIPLQTRGHSRTLLSVSEWRPSRLVKWSPFLPRSIREDWSIRISSQYLFPISIDRDIPKEDYKFPGLIIKSQFASINPKKIRFKFIEKQPTSIPLNSTNQCKHNILGNKITTKLYRLNQSTTKN